MATAKSPPESDTSTGKKLPPLPPGPVIFVIGAPGSGKGALCSRVCQQIPDSFRHLSVGDYLRELCSNTSENEALSKADSHLSPEEIAKYVQESKLLPPDTIIPLRKQKLLYGNSSPGRGWLIDGFPRDIETARAFEKEVSVSQGFMPRTRSDRNADICYSSPGHGTLASHRPPLQPTYRTGEVRQTSA